MARQKGEVLAGRAGSYRIEDFLGEGGMARVYKVRELASNSIYAVKEMVDRFRDSQERECALHQFRSEYDVLRTLRHPNIPSVVDNFSLGSSHFMVMELILGEDLDRLTRRRGSPWPEITVIRWGIELCRVLYYLHTRKPQPIIFRDIKPSNIILTSDGRLVLLDFGIARIFKPSKRSDTFAMGTEGYAAPEQYFGGGQTTPRSDIFALAATLYHLATGEAPQFAFPFSFEHSFPRATCLSASCCAALRKATDEDPAMRFENAASMKNALQDVLGISGATQITLQARSTYAPRPPYPPQVSRVPGEAPARQSPERTSAMKNPQETVSNPKFCDYCGALNRSKGRFCIKCGTKL
jgi:serine/threonine protein kinase